MLVLVSGQVVSGGAEEDRTPDLLRARQALSQLSYGPRVVGLGGFEPPTSPLSGVRSNQLSYRPCPDVSNCILNRPFVWALLPTYLKRNMWAVIHCELDRSCLARNVLGSGLKV